MLCISYWHFKYFYNVFCFSALKKQNTLLEKLKNIYRLPSLGVIFFTQLPCLIVDLKKIYDK